MLSSYPQNPLIVQVAIYDKDSDKTYIEHLLKLISHVL